ncbi:MAG: hypothetical protein COT21_02690 [Hadesarchaea archaeon CG08_land_8_20_14_0_20_51_8]|nr:MAG: hypothetical protein COT21_02690 [Hadesarchaea archaeon CG08_land_8_20_14_0_20_51_8]
MNVKLLSVVLAIMVGVAIAGGVLFVVKRPSEQPVGQSEDQPFEWVSDITPGSGAASPPGGTSNDGPWNHRVMSASSSDGLTWVKNEKIADQASVPDAVLDKDNNIRIYYIDWYNGHVISVALSHNGINWIYKKTTIQGEVAGSQGAISPVDPDIVLLPDGRYRLFYMYAGKIYSAISNCGINFVKEEGVRYQQEGMIYDPDVIKMGDVWRMFVSLGTRNLSTVSNDGLSFSRENELPFDGSVSCTIPLENGYRMYYMRQGGIFSSFSSDGRNWAFEGLRLDNAGDPTIIRLQNGTYKMFYKTWINPTP